MDYHEMMLGNTKIAFPDTLPSLLPPPDWQSERSLPLWKRLKGAKSTENLRRGFTRSSTRTCSEVAVGEPLRTTKSQNFKDSIAKSVRPGKSPHPLLVIPQTFASCRRRDSGYGSAAECSPGDTAFTAPRDCPSIPKFSWESSVSQFDHLLTSPQPLPASFKAYRTLDAPLPPHLSHLLCNHTAPAQPSFPERPPPVPPKTLKQQSSVPCFSRPLRQSMPDRSSKRLSDSQSKPKKRDSRDAAASQSPRPISSQTSRPISTQSGRPQSTQSAHLSVKRPSSNLSNLPSPNLGSENGPTSPRPTTASSAGEPVAGLNSSANGSTSNLSGLVCNIHRTTGTEPPALVGASTTIVGDKLYVFGGRRLSRRMPQLTRSLYELDLVQRHWTKIETRGNAPIPRYFHSICALGDSKLVCYGGMAQVPESAHQSDKAEEPGMTVMSDVHILDLVDKTWTVINTPEAPPGRYAHCAAILPSSGIFTSSTAARTAIQHNPADLRGNQGSIGANIDGRGGALMVVVGGQDSASQYIEQISVFNLRSMKWTMSTPFARNFGAYRSVVTPIVGVRASDIGSQQVLDERSFHDDSTRRLAEDDEDEDNLSAAGAPMLLYSNYNFLDVKLELQIRLRNGQVVDKAMNGKTAPPGLRFPNGAVIAGHFLVSGTFLTSTKQEYCLWALNLRTLVWTRVDVGANTLTSGSWNRGCVWTKRNSYVVLGNRKRNLGDDYNHRRLNFTHLCVVELEAFGLYENPRHMINGAPWPAETALLGTERHSQSLGLSLVLNRDLTDMDILSLTDERIPINSSLVAHRWGPYFIRLMVEAEKETSVNGNGSRRDSGSETATLRQSLPSRSSSLALTPTNHSNITSSTKLVAGKPLGSNHSANSSASSNASSNTLVPSSHSTSTNFSPASRLLYLPHTAPTIRALLYYLYTSCLPPPHHPLSTAQILCSLLQIARPYHVPGLLEATVQRLHQVLDAKSAAAIFNAAAMAAGAGDAVKTVPGGLRIGALRDGDTPDQRNSTGRPTHGKPSNLGTISNATKSFASSGGETSATDTDTDNDAAFKRQSRVSQLRHSHNRNISSASATGSEAETTTDDDDGDSGGESEANPHDTDAELSSASFGTAASDASTDATTTDTSASEAEIARRTRRSDGVRRRADGNGNSNAAGTSSAGPPTEKMYRGGISSVVGLQKRALRGLVEGRSRNRMTGESGAASFEIGRGELGGLGVRGSIAGMSVISDGGDAGTRSARGSVNAGGQGLGLGIG